MTAFKDIAGWIFLIVFFFFTTVLRGHSLDSLNLAVGSEVLISEGAAPHYSVSNRHGILSVAGNTGYLRTALTAHRSYADCHIEAGLDLLGSYHNYNNFYVQQLYAQADWKGFAILIGAKEQEPLFRTRRLSSGSLIWSGNARPIPQIRLSTTDFMEVPHTNDWLRIYFDIAYGKYMDSDYLTDAFGDSHFSFVTTDVYHHEKKLYFATKKGLPFELFAGIEHSVMFGGNQIKYYRNDSVGYSSNPHSIKDFFKVLIPSSGSDGSDVGDRQFVEGNHVGSICATLLYHIDRHQSVSAYCENLFEDGSGMDKHNGWDGLWGLEYKREGKHLIAGAVVEYLQTTDQSGPIHFAPDDFNWNGVGEATGSDDYYNNYFYDAYAHFGMANGTPMLKSPAYNKGNYLCFTDNRVKAIHAAIHGYLSDRLYYRLLGSYRRSWGTPFLPNEHIKNAFSLMPEVSYFCRRWDFTGAVAIDRGTLLGDNTAISIKAVYHVSL